ncbi:MAG: T9SS type A sorting domain-containing protein, partial [Bacteroidetes bacterium]|nr:T9SS type A sorting domain-containing protein [Bacteroidota bacterium]
PGETFTYDYVFPLDLSAINTTFTIQAWGVLTGDTIHNNDTTEVAVTNTQLVNSFPYLSDFESGTAGWTVTGTNPSWELGVANDSIINDTVTGNISWGTSLTGNYNTGETSFILGPCYDFTGLLLPIIGLDVWYETPTQGTARVQYSIDGGSTWVTITTGTIADNWYTGATGWSGSSGGWISAFTSVPALAGESDVRLRVRFAGGNSAGEGVAVDNITITDAPAYDLAVVSVDAPADGCGLSDEIVTVTIANYGAALVDTFQVAFNVDGIGTVIDTITDTLAAGTTMLYSFTATADLSTPNTSYLIAAWTILAEDTLNDNDTASIAVQHMNTIASFPYFENLELTDGNWISVGANSTWEYGIPAATVINDSATLNHAWVTNLTGDFTTSESSSLQGPCMDFSALTLPIIKLDVWYEIPTGLFGIGGGYARVQYSLDAGNTWDILLGGPNAANWYTGNGWTGSTGGWITASTSAPALAGASDVRLRVQFTGSSALAGTDEGIAVDNIKIYEAPPVDAGVAEILVPESGCGLGSETVVVSIVNYGTASISSGLAVEYIVNGGTPVAENITSTIVPGDTLIFAFATEADLSTPGGYSIEAYTTHAADTVNTNNDGTSITIFNTPVISAFPYDEDFETNNGYWSDQGASSSWDYGMPVGTLINYAFSGNNAWVTNLSGNHNSNETSYLLSPCFNFSSLVTPNLSMKIWYELPTLGNAIFEGSLDGGDSWFTIGSSNDPNWFTGASGWSGSSGDWTSVSHPLDTFAGQSHVRFRFYFNCSLAYLGSTEGLAVDNISISECVVPTASFTHSDSSLTVNFTNTSTDAVGYFWDFGDASISTQMSPTHTYAAGGTYEVCLVSSSDCASDTVCQSITVSVGIEENGMNHIAVFPNPATDKVLITLDKPIGGNSVIRIFNALGAVVLEQSVNSGELQFEINVSGLNAGVYTLNAGRVNTRLVVE